mmetsp:Transcript_21801/g.25205  ORF Transcript_21801/g.25205 Transcript_21801/m.25205 type:complete len:358 (-) Transcript_21801:632-1705(-)
MPQPVTTRWWWLGISVFVKCYTTFVINPNFDFLQSKGFRSKTAGFSSESVLVRLFLIHQDFRSILEEGWKEHPSFDELNSHLANARWSTVEQERTEEREDEMRRVNGPKGYEKKKKQAVTIKKSITKEINKLEDLSKHIDTIKANNPNSYWECMASTIKTVPQVTAVMKLFAIPNDMIVDEKTKNKRNMKGSEKRATIEAFEPITKDEFDHKYTSNETRIMKQNLMLKDIDLSRQQSLYDTFKKALPDQSTNTTFMRVPLGDLFTVDNHSSIEDIDVTESSISEKMNHLKEKIKTIEEQIIELKAKIKNRAPLPEDEDDNNDRQQQQGEVEEDEILGPSSTEHRTPFPNSQERYQSQ